MLAAEERAVLLQAVTDDPGAAVLAGRRQRRDRALEAVEGVGLAIQGDLERLVVGGSAGFASGHGVLRLARWLGAWSIPHWLRRQCPARSVPRVGATSWSGSSIIERGLGEPRADSVP